MCMLYSDWVGTALTYAAIEGNEDVVNYLLDAKADINGKFLEDQDVSVRM